MSRYIILKGSASAHCCFKFSIMDTAKPLIIGGEHYEEDGVKQYESICECFFLNDAETICNALNKGEACLKS